MRSTACSLLIAGLVIVGVTACGNDGSTASDPPVGSTSATTVPTSTTKDPRSTTSVAIPGTTDPTPDAPPLPTLPEPGHEVVRITTQPMFPAVAPFVPAGPDVVVYADGHVLASFNGNFAVQPMLWPYQEGRIDTSDVVALLELAADTGLLGAPETQLPRMDISDAPATTVTITHADGSVTHRAFALQRPSRDDSDYVRHLREFTGAVERAVQPARDTSGAGFYEPTAVAIAAAPGEPRSGNPAPIEWPGEVRLADLAECTVVDDPRALEALRGQHAAQTYRDGDVTYVIEARISVPGDATCAPGRPTDQPQPSEPPTGSTPGVPDSGPVIRLSTQAMFPVTPPHLPVGPDVLVYADGTVYAPSQVAFEAAPWAWPYEAGTVSPAVLAKLLAHAAQLRLLSPADARPRTDVADAPVTELTITTTDGTSTHRVEALASPPDDDPDGYYARLGEFAAALETLARQAIDPTAGFYTPTAFAVLAAPTEGDVTSAEPWPGSVPLSELTSCGLVDDPELLDLFRGGNPAAGPFADEGVVYSIAVATAFPDQTSC